MTNETTYFDNKFESNKITPQRLCDFSSDTASKMALHNSGGKFTAIIASLATATTALQNEINEVDTSLNIQKGATLTVNEVMNNFSKTMGDEEPFVARALGGSNTAAYLEFYPHKISEYTKASKEDMDTLTNRVFIAANKYTLLLGDTLTDNLAAFKTNWATVSGTQETQLNTVDAKRGVRTTKRTTLELLLMESLGIATQVYPGNAEACKQIFNFNQLYGAYHQKVYEISRPPTATGTILEHRFAADATIKVTVLTDAIVRLNLSSVENDAQNQPQEVPGNSEQILKISSFDADVATNRFLVIANLSTTTEARVKVELL